MLLQDINLLLDFYINLIDLNLTVHERFISKPWVYVIAMLDKLNIDPSGSRLRPGALGALKLLKKLCYLSEAGHKSCRSKREYVKV